MDEKWINQLMTIELFKDIEKEELKSVLSCLKSSIKTYKKRDIITIEKDKLTGIGVVLEGEVSVSKEPLAGD
ncbi:MAG TPA: transcriptional regulator, partial [Clostridium sp.]|nr:transcriptional regulator [Clostridium sp.]